MPPLSKGGGLTARHKLLLCCVLLATHPPFYSPNSSAAKTEGLQHQPFQNRTIPPTFRNANIYMHLYAFTFALSLSLFVGRGACPSRCTEPFHPHNLLKSTSTASPRTTSLPPLSKVRCCRPKKFGRLPEGLPPVASTLAIPTTVAKEQ